MDEERRKKELRETRRREVRSIIQQITDERIALQEDQRKYRTILNRIGR